MEQSHPRKLGRYEVDRLLARGGMAELFLARLPGIEGFAKQVVVKRVLPTLARDREFIEMFLEEARLAATLQHQNVVQVHDIGQDDIGFFFAMEYLHGADVGEIMRTVSSAGGELPLEIALEIARNACAGLHYAHGRLGANGMPLGIVHRDVSPQNVFVTFDGGIKVLDFGIAKAVQQLTNHYTRSGTLRGKLPYMSPEQCQGQPIDRRSDVFSLAVVLWEMTVGERLFGANGEGDFDILKSIVEQGAPAPSTRKPGYPAALETVVMKALHRDRTCRHQSCDELQSELETFMRTTGRWATARDVSAFMQSRFADRAAASLQMRAVKDEPGGEIVPFPRATRLISPDGTAATIDLPKPDRVTVEPPPEPSAPPHTAHNRSYARRFAIAIAILAMIALAGVGGYAMRGSSSPAPQTASPVTRPVAPVVTPMPASAPPAEDELWFQSDDVLVTTEGSYTGTRKLGNLQVAKRVREPDGNGVTAFLTANGVTVESATYFATHLARADELVIGREAFCQVAATAKTAPRPKTKRESRHGPWIVGKITDIAELPRGRVTVADVECEVGGVRVIDR